MRRIIVVVFSVLALIVPFAGTASAHHEEEGSFRLLLRVETPPILGDPLVIEQYVDYYPDDEDPGTTGPYARAIAEQLCHAPPFQCFPIDDEPPDEDEATWLPVPDLPLPLPPPPFLF
jgi:hypothetical protein